VRQLEERERACRERLSYEQERTRAQIEIMSLHLARGRSGQDGSCPIFRLASRAGRALSALRAALGSRTEANGPAICEAKERDPHE